MKLILSFIAAACVSINSQADLFQLEGVPYKPPTNAMIAWQATNSFPHGLWVYKVLPESFSMAVVSNAMKLGLFEMKDFSKGEHPTLKDKHLICFNNKNEFNHRRVLYIAPSLGVMEFSSMGSSSVPIEDVPTSDEAETLARNVLFQLGIDSSLLSDKVQKGYDDTRTQIDREGHKLGEARVFRRGVAFSRRIDGIQLSDSRCFLIHFGNHGRIEDFSLIWRNILPYESHDVLTPEQIVKIIESGKAFLPEQFSDLSGIDSARHLSVVKATPRYYNGIGKEHLDVMYPYLDLEILADVKDKDAATFHLTCQIISNNCTNVIK